MKTDCWQNIPCAWCGRPMIFEVIETKKMKEGCEVSGRYRCDNCQASAPKTTITSDEILDVLKYRAYIAAIKTKEG